MQRLPVLQLTETADLVVVPRGRRLPATAWSTLVSELPPAEQDRIRLLTRHDSQLESAIGWHLMLALASRYDVSVRRNSVGRPVADPPADVSLSHGGGWVAAAGSRCGRVGVDVEGSRAVSPALARRCLSTAELTWLGQARDAHGRRERFLRLWTAKEAYLKAVGTGLAADPRSFTVDCTVDPPRLTHADEPCWRFRSFTPAEGVRVTLCLEHGA
jgi:4'-phosphopantetheinyl transferase